MTTAAYARFFEAAALRGMAWFVPGMPCPPRAEPTARPLLEAWSTTPVWSIEQPLDLYFTGTVQEHWEPADFRNLRLPAPILLMEGPAPSRSVSVIHGVRTTPLSDSSAGIGVQITEKPISFAMGPTLPKSIDATDLTLCVTAGTCMAGAPVTTIPGICFILMNKHGVPRSWPGGELVRWRLSPELLPSAAHAWLSSEEAAIGLATFVSGLIWPACLAIDAANDGRAEHAPYTRTEAAALRQTTGRPWPNPLRMTIRLPPRGGPQG